MSKLTLDPKLRAKLNGLNEQIEICDETGKTVGHYLPDDVYQRLLFHSIDSRVSELWWKVQEQGNIVLSVDQARSILQLEFTSEDRARMHVLAEKAREGTLTPPEQEETRNYERVGNLLGVLKSKARQFLKKVAPSNGSSR